MGFAINGARNNAARAVTSLSNGAGNDSVRRLLAAELSVAPGLYTLIDLWHLKLDAAGIADGHWNSRMRTWLNSIGFLGSFQTAYRNFWYEAQLTGSLPGSVPANALVDRDGNPIVDRDGNYIIVD
jgi:hypothetical protein